MISSKKSDLQNGVGFGHVRKKDVFVVTTTIAVSWFTHQSNSRNRHFFANLYQGMLTEWDDSVQLTSSLRLVFV